MDKTVENIVHTGRGASEGHGVAVYAVTLLALKG